MLWLVAGPSFARMLEVKPWLSFLYSCYNNAMAVALMEVVLPSVHTVAVLQPCDRIVRRLHPAFSTALIQFTGDRAAPAM